MNDEEIQEQIVSTTPQLSIIESQERANIDMLIATAKKYPRDIVRVKRTMEAMATLDEDTAESCNYHLERNGKSIDGPSVRMAEIAVATYQNIRCGSRVISNDGKVITGQAFCHDLENNTFIAWETQRRITDKSGRTYGEDMQVVTGNAASAIAFRNAVFKVIPGALIKPVAEKARQVAVGDLKTLSERRTRALKKFASIGVKETQVLAFLGRSSIELVDIADVEKLFGVFTAIREGSTTIEEQFPATGTVVQPNFNQPHAAPIPGTGATLGEQTGTRPDEMPRRPRGRPPKQHAESPQTPAVASQPATAMPTPSAEQTPPESSSEKQGSIFQEPAKLTPLQEIQKRLADEHIDHDRFLLVMHDFGMVDCERAEISAGMISLSAVNEKFLKAALSDWRAVIENLPEA
jgi:hypothetical protein